MHELYLAQSIIDSVMASLPGGIEPAGVKEIHIITGRLDAVVPDNLRFLFDVIKGESGFAGTSLLVEEEPIKCLCTECGTEFILDEPNFVCPVCKSGSLNVIAGRGIRVTRIEAEIDEEPSPGGRTFSPL